MTYYELTNTAEPTITGAYPQLDLVDHSNMKKMQDLDHQTFVSSSEDLAELKFTRKTIVTDLLTCGHISVHGFVVSEKFKNLIEKLVKEGIKTTPFQFLPLSIKKSKKINESEVNFYLFQLIPDTSIINYKETVFMDLSKNRELVKVKNHETYSPFFRIKKLALKNDYDIFIIPYGLSKVLISEKVKNAIEQHSITGTEEIYKMSGYEIL